LLDETKQLITSKNIPKSFDGFKIVQFSDTHIDFQYSLKQFKKLVETMNQMQPDLIVFTGDLVDKPQHFQSSEALIAILRELKAKRSEEHTSELQSRSHLVCRILLEKK